MRKVAIYDLDGTVLRHATFTPFLLFAARRHQPWKVLLAPIWIAAMVLYKLGLFDRRTLKQFGLRLFLGHRMTASKLQAISDAFADHVVPRWIAPGAAKAMAADRAEGCSLILATAAMEFYACGIGERLGFDHIVATRSRPLTNPALCALEGANCYGAEKPVRVKALFEALGWTREDCEIRFYSDSTSDGPLFDWSDRAVLINPGRKGQRMAAERGWEVQRFY